MTAFLSITPHRTEIMEANLPEGQEFLSGTEDKKNPHFTDVSSIHLHLDLFYSTLSLSIDRWMDVLAYTG